MHLLHNPKTNTWWLVVASGDRMQINHKEGAALSRAGIKVQHTTETASLHHSGCFCHECEIDH